MRLDKRLMPVLGVGIILLAVITALATGTWVSSGREEISRKMSSGQIAPEDIKGWMTLDDVAKSFNVDASEVARRAGLPAGFRLDQPLKEAEAAVDGFEMDVVRETVAAMLGRPAARDSEEQAGVSDPSAAPVPQTPVNGQHNGTTPDPTHTPEAGSAAPGVAASPKKPVGSSTPPGSTGITGSTTQTASPAVVSPAGSGSHETESAGLPKAPEDVRGVNTLAEVSKAFGIPLEKLKGALGFPADADPNLALREFKSTVPGFEVEAVREAVRAMGK